MIDDTMFLKGWFEMILKELVLNSLESLQQFRINGKTMTKSMYEQYADYEIESWHVDVIGNDYYIEVKIDY